MNSFQHKQFPPPQFLHQTFTSLQTHFSDFFDNLRTNLHSKSPLFAKVSAENQNTSIKNKSMSAEAIDERLAGVPVYALSNGSQEFVLVSGSSGKNLGLFCFSEGDAQALLQQMKKMDSSMSSNSQVVAVALSKIFQLKVEGVALRLIPEASQIKNALTLVPFGRLIFTNKQLFCGILLKGIQFSLYERKSAGLQDESFPGIPVFQSKSLILRSQNKRYRPVFFRKEDLEKSLLRASSDQKQLNPAFRKGDIQVAVLEEIVQGMKDSASALWDDVVFIPPGFDVSTDPSQQHQAS
ncbi:protein TIC 22-like, chloroplastic isoform X1 [Henckelia pumila]|uniref:protein TIC 22-like, chloroplastic isoform X1 n=1 Tax=Henckelia pumila TaxID=405737 RepID=UPI003C6E06C9